MDEIERIKTRIQNYKEATTKLDRLDPKTKEVVLMAIRNAIFFDEVNLKQVENNLAQMADVIKK